jgi:hypothetical protein
MLCDSKSGQLTSKGGNSCRSPEPASRTSEPEGWSGHPARPELARVHRAQAIIGNGVVRLGVNREGHLNVGGGTPSSGTGTTVVGLRFVPTNAEATSAGCPCEGWGVGDGLRGIMGLPRPRVQGSSTSRRSASSQRLRPRRRSSTSSIPAPGRTSCA